MRCSKLLCERLHSLDIFTFHYQSPNQSQKRELDFLRRPRKGHWFFSFQPSSSSSSPASFPYSSTGFVCLPHGWQQQQQQLNAVNTNTCLPQRQGNQSFFAALHGGQEETSICLCRAVCVFSSYRQIEIARKQQTLLSS